MNPTGRYRAFWQDVGDRFPDLGGAPSTDYYRRNEERLLSEHLPQLRGARLLKTDLWDEAKNTRILRWAADRGARVFGVDISKPIAAAAYAAFGGSRLRGCVADVRELPFATASFDAAYSMGTVEHFLETAQALVEIHRVLRPGGVAIIGVPNRLDPFLRPLMVWALTALGLYAYGYEKSFSRRQFRGMLEAAGFDVVAETGILFIPGWLRMLDLVAHTRRRRLTRLTGAAVRFFETIDDRWAGARRHGYLLATVCRRR